MCRRRLRLRASVCIHACKRGCRARRAWARGGMHVGACVLAHVVFQSSRSHAMGRQGIGVRFNTNVTALAKTASGIAATLTDGSVEEYDVVMFATGASLACVPCLRRLLASLAQPRLSPCSAQERVAMLPHCTCCGCCRAVCRCGPSRRLLAFCPHRGQRAWHAWGRAQAAHRDAEL